MICAFSHPVRGRPTPAEGIPTATSFSASSGGRHDLRVRRARQRCVGHAGGGCAFSKARLGTSEASRGASNGNFNAGRATPAGQGGHAAPCGEIGMDKGCASGFAAPPGDGFGAIKGPRAVFV